MDNLRKRTERDVADARKYAVAKFAGDMLVVGDNLRRALDAVPAEQRDAGDEALKALIDGVEVTEREMDRLLERNGVTRIAAKGERFDPHRHQAMFEVPDSDRAGRHRRRRSCRKATRSATACCAPRWSASRRTAQGGHAGEARERDRRPSIGRSSSRRAASSRSCLRDRESGHLVDGLALAHVCLGTCDARRRRRDGEHGAVHGTR